MTKFVVDGALRATMTAPLELTDEAGQTIGYVITPQQFGHIGQLEEDRKTLYQWANSLVTNDDLAAAEAEGGEHTFDDTTDFLRKLEMLERTKSA
jgi:hypothetical protein